MSVADLPSVFGFSVESNVPLRFLRRGGGGERLCVELAIGAHERPREGLVGEWQLHGTAYPASASLYRVPNGFEYWTTDAGRYLVDLEQGRIEVPPHEDEILREQRLHGMPMLLSFAHRGDFSLHAAAVEVNGRAVILAGPSKSGKTTLAYAFHAHGHRVLSEDLVCCVPAVTALRPGPALVRVRRDVYAGSPSPGTELVADRPDRVFLRLDSTTAGGSAPVPIAGIYFLRSADQVELVRASEPESVRDLWHLGYRMPNPEGRAESFRRLSELVSQVPVWNLYRPLRMGVLPELIEAVSMRSRG